MRKFVTYRSFLVTNPERQAPISHFLNSTTREDFREHLLRQIPKNLGPTNQVYLAYGGRNDELGGHTCVG